MLYELATQRPSGRERLAEVDGASRAFIDNYGDVMVQSIVAFCSQPLVSLELDGWQASKRLRASGADPPAAAARGGSARNLPKWITAGRQAGSFQSANKRPPSPYLPARNLRVLSFTVMVSGHGRQALRLFRFTGVIPGLI